MYAGHLKLATEDHTVIEETRRFNQFIEERLAQFPRVETQDPETSRTQREEGQGPYPPPVRSDRAREMFIDGRDGHQIPLRVFDAPKPDECTGVLLHVHGGGWVLGAHDLQDPLLEALSNELNCAVVSVGYRLSPEHKFPTPNNDCVDAALWLVGHSVEHFGAQKLAIAGESAGAHLSLCTLIALRDHHPEAARFLAANLVFGVFDLSLTPSQASWGERNLILSTPLMHWFYDHYLPQEQDPRDPLVSPLYARLEGLPKTLLSVGTQDLLVDDSLFLQGRLALAGVDSELVLFPEAPHGFIAYPTEMGQVGTAALRRLPC